MSFGYFGRGQTQASQGEICIYGYMATPPFTQIYFRQKSVGNQPSRPSMQGQGIRRAHTAAVPWLYHAPQAQPCLSDVEICTGLMLVADLACVCGANSNLPVLPRIIQLPCAITGHGAGIYFLTRALGLSRFDLDLSNVRSSPHQGNQCARNLLELLLGLSEEVIADTNVGRSVRQYSTCSPDFYLRPRWQRGNTQHMMRVSVDTVLRSKTLRLTGSATPLHRSASCILPGATAPMTTPDLYSTDPIASLGGILCLRDLLDPKPASLLKSKFMGPQA